MNARQLRARLDRLTACTAVRKKRDRAQDFTIDPMLAKALRNEQQQLSELLRKRWSCSQHGGSLSAAEEQEEVRLRASIAERVRAINCPPGCGAREARKDENRLHTLYCKRLAPRSCGGGVLTDAEDAEEAQLTARVAAYDESPEGRARSRIFDLTLKIFSEGLSTAEQNELDGLRTLYPDPPLDPDDPLNGVCEVFSEALKENCD